MPQNRGHQWALIGFALATLISTYPIAFEPGTALMGLGDTLLNSWILAWEVHSLFGPESASFFDTNIFHPHRNTLAYSEFLLPQLAVAIPVILWSGNPVLAHNVVLLLSMFTTGLATYLLAHRITRSRSASFAAGLILAFCPFMISHLVHVQILFAAGIPLTFLFLFRWLESLRAKDAAMLGLLYAVQALANAYYAVYLAFFAGMVLLAVALRRRSWSSRRFWLQLALAASIAIALMGPFYGRYLQLQQEMGFQRTLPPAASPEIYLAVPESNRIYGEITGRFQRQEGYLFPGVVASLLALTGLYRWARPPARASDHPTPSKAPAGGRSRRSALRWLDGSILVCAALLLLLAMGGSIETRVGPLPLRIGSFRNPAILLALLSAIRWWLQRRRPTERGLLRLPTSGWTFPAILLGAFVLSFGTDPYLLLYRWVPGFSGLRAVSRIHVMFMFALAILAAQGLAYWLGRLSKPRRRLLAAAAPILILIEYLSAPLPVVAAPQPEDFPAVERFVSEQREDSVYVAYPFRISDNILRLYYSTRHWRSMVNGFSGFIPPLYRELADKGRFYPDEWAIEDLQDLGVDLILIDTTRYRAPRRQRVIETLGRMAAVELLEELDGSLVYRLQPKAEGVSPAAPSRGNLVEVEPERLSLRASFEPGSLGRAVDGDRRTRWMAPMEPGQWLEIDWGEAREIAELHLDISGFPHDYPRGYRLEVSLDGRRWETIEQRPVFFPPIRDFVRPKAMILRFDLVPCRARALRFVQLGESDERTWSVVELSLLVRAP